MDPVDASLSVATTVRTRRFAGDHRVLRAVTTAGVELDVRLWQDGGPEQGAAVTLAFDPTATIVLPAAHGVAGGTTETEQDQALPPSPPASSCR